MEGHFGRLSLVRSTEGRAILRVAQLVEPCCSFTTQLSSKRIWELFADPRTSVAPGNESSLSRSCPPRRGDLLSVAVPGGSVILCLTMTNYSGNDCHFLDVNVYITANVAYWCSVVSDVKQSAVSQSSADTTVTCEQDSWRQLDVSGLTSLEHMLRGNSGGSSS